MSTGDLEQAVKTTGAILGEITPDHLDMATPCASWKVRDVINHVTGWTYQFGRIAKSGEADSELLEQDYVSGDFNASYAEAASQLVTAFQVEDAMTKPMRLIGSERPGAVVMGIATTEIFAHGWDLARAIGASTDLEPELATRLLERARTSIPDQVRGEEGKAFFGRPVEITQSASPADEFAAFLGRHV